jgi:transcriptional regulator with XRE-family HTH domain
MSTVRKLREKMLLTQTELANVLKVSRTTIAAYESGLTMPRVKMIRKLMALGSENGMSINANDFFKEDLSTDSVDKGVDQ